MAVQQRRGRSSLVSSFSSSSIISEHGAKLARSLATIAPTAGLTGCLYTSTWPLTSVDRLAS